VIELNREDLTRHLLVLGSTGAGKTTLLRAIIRQLIEHEADNADVKPALVVLDFKGDQTADIVRGFAERAGRREDVRVLSPNSDVAYDFFRDFTRLADVQEFTERLLFGCGMVSAHDRFWDEYRQNAFAAALTWLLLTAGNRHYAPWIAEASSWLLTEGLPAELQEKFGALKATTEGLPPGSTDRATAEYAIRVIEDWERGMDYKTRANVRATLHNALRPLLAPAVQHLFRADAKQHVSVADTIRDGGALVVSANSFLEPQTASLLGKCVAADFFKAVFARGTSRGQPRRLAMLVADEYHLAATVGGARYDHAAALPLLREFDAGVIAGTQGIANLDRSLGAANRSVLVPCFNTQLFMRSSEPETAAFAAQVCGTVRQEEQVRESITYPGPPGLRPVIERTLRRQVERLICTPGALAQLEPGQAFLRQAGTPVCPTPVWIAAEDTPCL
jgi:energy-coupling factor transporter ATP-binding protein EcfA2